MMSALDARSYAQNALCALEQLCVRAYPLQNAKVLMNSLC